MKNIATLITTPILLKPTINLCGLYIEDKCVMKGSKEEILATPDLETLS